MKLVPSLIAAITVLWAATTSAQQPPQVVASYTPEQQQALEYYRRNYPAYYAKYYAPVTTAGTPTTRLPQGGNASVVQPPPDGEDEAEEEAAGQDVAGMVSGETERDGARTLGGHTFQYPRLVDNAFTAANFKVGSSVEVYHQGDVRASLKQVDGSVDEITYDRDLVFLRMRYGVDFAPHEVITFGLDADYLIEVGANQQAILLYGGETGYDFRPNAKVRIYRSDEHGLQLSLSAYGAFSGGIRAVPTGLLTHVGNTIPEDGDLPDLDAEGCTPGDVTCAVEDGAVTDAVAVTRDRKGGGGSLNFAKSVGRYLGAQVSAGFEGARATVTAADTGPVSATGMIFTAGASPSLNFYPGFPVALTLEYRFEFHRQTYDPNEEAGMPGGAVVDAKAHRFGGGVYYSGRRDLQLGWSASASLLEDADRGPQDVAADQPDALLVAAQFDMRYFF